MPTPLCATFHRLAVETHDRLGFARGVRHQMLEETFTDLHMLELKRLHPREIACITIPKARESVIGADWEWWLTDPLGRRWFGMRVQAKILHLASDQFQHLHYKPKRSRAYQCTLLKKAAAAKGLLPVYCLYSHSPIVALPGLRGPTPANGCSLLPADEVERLRRRGKERRYAEVMKTSVPWEELVCREMPSELGEWTLPDLAWHLFNKRYQPLSDDALDVKTQAESGQPLAPGVRRAPPAYVTAILKGEELPEALLDEDLRGVVVIGGKGIEGRPAIDIPPLPASMGSDPQSD